MAKNAATQIEDNMARTTTPAEKTPSFLSKLEFSNLKRSAAAGTQDPVQRARLKLIDGVKEQIKHVQAEIKGEEYAPTRTRYVETDGGKRVPVEQPKRRMVWYWQHEGTWYTECRYGSSPIDFGSGTAIKAGKNLSDVVAVLDLIIQATESGQIDEELMAVAARRGRKPATESASPKERLQARSKR